MQKLNLVFWSAILLLILIACQQERSPKRTSKSADANAGYASGGGRGNPASPTANVFAASKTADQANIPTGNLADNPISPENSNANTGEFSHCAFHPTIFKRQSTYLGPYNICQSSVNKTKVRLQLQDYPQDVPIAFLAMNRSLNPRRNEEGQPQFISSPLSNIFNARSITSYYVYDIDLAVGENDYTEAQKMALIPSITHALITREEETDYQSISVTGYSKEIFADYHDVLGGKILNSIAYEQCIKLMTESVNKIIAENKDNPDVKIDEVIAKNRDTSMCENFTNAGQYINTPLTPND